MSGRSRSRIARTCVMGFLLVLASGCGSGTATITGVVTFQGKPVPGGSVVIYCSDKQIVRGLIGTDGQYSIPNVPYGPAVVTIQSPSRLPSGMRLQQNLPPSINGPLVPSSETDGATRGGGIPPRYALPDESGLSVVVDQRSLTYHIDLKP